MPARGKLGVYLGFAAGVGKTYKMLEEGQRLRHQAVDVVIGYFEAHERPATIALTRDLEMVPRRIQEYRGVLFSEMDTEAIRARHPAVCLVDELPHTNPPGSARAKRWQDVEWLLDQGCDVLTTLNLQHLESLNDQILQISGVRVRETVPDWVLAQAQEVVMVDLTPRALLHRLERGVVYPPEQAQRALEHFFKESTLGALRELALRQTAHVTEFRQETAREADGPGPAPAPAGDGRVLVHVTAAPSTAMVIRRAKRVADYYHADCFAVYIQSSRAAAPGCNASAGTAVQKHLAFARNLRLHTHTLLSADTAAALVAFARQHQIRQIFTAREQPRPRRGLLRRREDLLARIVRLARDMQVTIVAARPPQPLD